MEYTRACLDCKKKFTTKVKTKLFCNDKCRVNKWMKENPRVRIASSTTTSASS